MVGKNPEDYRELLATSLAGFERANASGFTDSLKVTDAILTNEAADGAQVFKVADLAIGDILGPATIFSKTEFANALSVDLRIEGGASVIAETIAGGAGAPLAAVSMEYLLVSAPGVLEVALTPDTGANLAAYTDVLLFVLYGHIPIAQFCRW